MFAEGDFMPVNRDMSKKTWDRIDELLHNVTRQAAKIKANEIYRDADMAIALLRNLSGEIQMEDQQAERERAENK